MSKYSDTEVSGFILNSGYSLKQILRVARQLKKDRQEKQEEADAEYEMGRSAMPAGYTKRRTK